MEIQRRTLGPGHTDQIDSLIKLGLILRYKGDKARAEESLRRAVDLTSDPSVGADVRARAKTNLGVLLMDAEHYDAAEPLLREALALDRATPW